MNKKFTLDENSITIPKGTDVVLKSPQKAEDSYILKAGTVGRVMNFYYNTYEIITPGGRKVICQRDQLVVQKQNVLHEISRSQYEWKELKNEIIYEAIVGSQAWGLSDESSDTDKKGIFLLPFSATASIYNAPDEIRTPETDSQYWEVQKAIYQGLRADANTLETLWSPLVTEITEIGEELRKNRAMFISKYIYGSFGHYAMSQFKKIQQKLNRYKVQNQIIVIIGEHPDLNMDQVSEILAEKIPCKTPYEAKELITDLYQSLYDRGIIPQRGFDILKEFLKNAPEDEIMPARKYRPKNAYNLLRLLYSGINWMTEGEPLIEVKGIIKKELLSVKKGEIPIEETLEKAHELAERFEKVYEKTSLPEEPDYKSADEFLLLCREHGARKYLASIDLKTHGIS
ncbi:MAG: nucleotidyltransferase domain-containing protein [Candidatus Eremiobacterota bacterium]